MCEWCADYYGPEECPVCTPPRYDDYADDEKDTDEDYTNDDPLDDDEDYHLECIKRQRSQSLATVRRSRHSRKSGALATQRTKALSFTRAEKDFYHHCEQEQEHEIDSLQPLSTDSNYWHRLLYESRSSLDWDCYLVDSDTSSDLSDFSVSDPNCSWNIYMQYPRVPRSDDYADDEDEDYAGDDTDDDDEYFIALNIAGVIRIKQMM